MPTEEERQAIELVVPWFSLIAKVVNTLIGVSINFSWVVVLNFMLFPLFSYRLASKFTTCERTRWLATILLCGACVTGGHRAFRNSSGQLRIPSDTGSVPC